MPLVYQNENHFNQENINPEAVKNIQKNLKGVQKKKALGERTNVNKQTAVTKPKAADIKRHKISYSVQKKRNKSKLSSLEAKYGKNLHVSIDPVDIEDLNSPRYAADYISDVMQTYKELETAKEFLVDPNYMDKQADLNEKMRELLIDWLNQVHTKFQLNAPTFYLGITILDRFLSTTNVKRNKLQLVGCCALWIAAKYEEIYAPEINDFVLISDSSYTFNEMVKAEKYMVESLKYKLGVPTVYMFLRRYLKVHGCSVRLQHIAGYIMEFVQQKYEFLKYKPSHLAAAVLLFAVFVEEFNVEHNKENVWGDTSDAGLYSWDDTIERVTGKTRIELLEDNCISEVQSLLIANSASQNRAVYRKYCDERFMFVGKLDYSFPIVDEDDDDETMDTEE